MEGTSMSLRDEPFDDRVKDTMRKCRHFNGIQHDVCLAGVDYRTFSPGKMPCLAYPERPSEPCEKFANRTRKEAEVVEHQRDENIARFLSAMREGRCPHCQHAVEESVQVGPCIYAKPCGHRLGQGRAKGRRR
jgi:hypothetical protein